MTRGPWSDLEKQQLQSLIADGIRRDKMPQIIGRSDDAIRHQINALILGKRPSKRERPSRSLKRLGDPSPQALSPDEPGEKGGAPALKYADADFVKVMLEKYPERETRLRRVKA